MRAIDTNVAARLLVEDDPRQAAKAREIVSAGVLAPVTVLLELSWLLESRYRLSRRDVHALLSEFIAGETVSVHDRDQVEWALARYGKGAALDDMMHVAGSAGASSFVTFDRSLGKQAGPGAPVPVEVVKV